jgi:ribonuclease HII
MTPKSDPAMLPPTPDLAFEQALWAAGVDAIAGIDEAGRGALAGPVAAAMVILPTDFSVSDKLHGVRDSKQMTPLQRQNARMRILEVALSWGVGFASCQEIDILGILPATRLAAWRAVEMSSISPRHLLLDYLFLPDCALPQTSLVKGDRRSLSIAAASVMAKTSRDALMIELDSQYLGYGFATHKGYGTALHRAALQRLGMSQEHRRSFHFKRPLSR